MTADIIPLPKRDGNGAREALADILSEPLVGMLVAFDKARATDAILLRLAAAGFIIVPMEDK